MSGTTSPARRDGAGRAEGGGVAESPQCNGRRVASYLRRRGACCGTPSKEQMPLAYPHFRSTRICLRPADRQISNGPQTSVRSRCRTVNIVSAQFRTRKPRRSARFYHAFCLSSKVPPSSFVTVEASSKVPLDIDINREIEICFRSHNLVSEKLNRLYFSEFLRRVVRAVFSISRYHRNFDPAVIQFSRRNR